LFKSSIRLLGGGVVALLAAAPALAPTPMPLRCSGEEPAEEEAEVVDEPVVKLFPPARSCGPVSF